MKIASLALGLTSVLLAASLVSAEEKPRVSPHETVSATIDGNEISVVYGRPYTKDPKSGEKRKIWGGLVPYGEVWRMGADEATILNTKVALDFGGTKIPAGSYSLYMLPAEKSDAKLIVNKQTGQWGTKHDEKQDLTRINLKMETAEKAPEQFTITIEKTEGGGGILKMAWDTAEYWVPFKLQK